MFNNVYNSTFAKVANISQRGSRQADLSLLQTDTLDPEVGSLLWADGIGCGGDLDREIIARSAASKSARFGNRVYAIVPIYVTSICAEHCVYCNFRAGNKGAEIERIRLSDPELAHEAIHLIKDKGLRVLELVYATDPEVRVDSMCRHVEMVRRLLDREGGGVVGINAEALDETEYHRLRDAGLTFSVLWQETYDRARYRELHPGSTKKTKFEYRLEAYERMVAAGISTIGMGVLSGLADWRADWAMLMEHEAYLHREYGVVPAILGVPRLKPAAGAILQETPFVPSRSEFLVAIALHNIFSPQCMAFVNTREAWDTCVEMCRGGGSLFTFNCSTIPGGYSLGHRGYQFPTGSYDAPVFAAKLSALGMKPVFDWRYAEVEIGHPAPVEACSVCTVSSSLTGLL